MTAWIGGHRRWIWLVAGVLVLALLVLGVVRALTAGAGTKPKAVATVAVDKGAVSTDVATTGTLQPAQTRSLSFTVAGTVESIAVRAGTEVTAGQELAKVDDTDAAATVATDRDALNQAETALSDAKESAANATSTTTSGCTGANVPAAYSTRSASASPSAGASHSPSPGVSPTRTSTPAPTRTATPAPTRTPAPAATTGSPRGGAAPATSCATARGGAGQGGGNTGGGTDAVLSAEQRVTQANVTLANAEDALAGATITAPIAGRILAVSGKVGSQVGSGSTFITLADVYDMQISAAFPEADADRLAVRQKATVTLADRPGADLGATVVQVDPVGTSDGTMVRFGVLLSFTEAPKDLLVGQSAAVRVTTGSATDVLRVPSTAVHDVSGTSATVLRDGAPVKVGIGLRGDQYTQITSGLAEGETVVRSW